MAFFLPRLGRAFSCRPAGTRKSSARWGKLDVREIAPGQTHIEGKFGRFASLRGLAPLNLILAQMSLGIMLVRRLNRGSISVVRAEDAQLNGLLAWIYSLIFRAPLVIGLWGNPDKGREQAGAPLLRMFRKIWIERAIEGFVLRRAAMVVVQCEDELNYAIARGVPEQRAKIFGMSNVLDPVHRESMESRLARPSVIAPLGISARETLIVVSRLERVKLLDQMIVVLKELVARGRDVALIVAGDGPAEAELQGQADQLGVGKTVFFVGNQTQDWLARAYAEVSLLIAPYTGRALAEAALSGIPVVAYDVEWHRQLIINDDTGKLVRFHDPVAMANAAEQLLRDPDHARRLGAKLREHALLTIDPSAADEMQIAAFKDLLQLEPLDG